jgi:hypothetical protein
MNSETHKEELDTLIKKLKAAEKILEEMNLSRIKRPGSDENPQLNVDIKDKEDEILFIKNKIEQLKKTDTLLQNFDPYINFVNRLTEIETITYPSAPAYYLLDAPVGFGKTSLMKELQKKFQEKNWLSVYVAVNENDTLDQLISLIIKDLNINSQLFITASLSSSLRFAGIIRKYWVNEVRPTIPSKEGIVFLIDLDKRPSKLILEGLLTDLIPLIDSNLRELDDFANKQNRFRVVISGRRLGFLARKVKSKPLSLVVRQLTPFNFDVIRISVSNKLSIYDEKVVNKLASKLLFLTGGHPGAMAQILDLFINENLEFDLFFENYDNEIWKTILYPIIQEIRNEISNSSIDLINVIDEICIYRYLDAYTLRYIIQKRNLNTISDEFKLADELTQNYILTRKDRFYKDDITRRLLTIWQWRNSSGAFSDACLEAQNQCQQRLLDTKVNDPERWAIEYLFQALQQHVNSIKIMSTRKETSEKFFSDYLPLALRYLFEDRDYWEEHNALIQAMEDDWEFQYTVNYYLRENDQYTSEPYEKIKEFIDNFSIEK